MIFQKITFQDKLFLTKHLAVMVKSGITIVEAVSILEEQTESARFKQVLKQITKQLQNGQTLSHALEKQQGIFDAFYISIIKVGEESGTLEKSLSFLAEQLKKDYELKKKIQSALLYPSIVLIAAGLMSSFIAIFILPQLVVFFEALDVDLPVTTQILLFVAKLMQDFGIIILIVFIALFLTGSRLVMTSWLRPAWHSFLLHIPLLGKILINYELARFCRNFGTLLHSGVPITRSLEILKDTLSNEKYKESTMALLDSTKKGQSLTSCMERISTRLFPKIVVKMVSVGEHTGGLDQTLLYLGDFYEEEVDTISKNLTPILEPILLIVIGLIVGFIALAIISPIYELTGSIR